MERHRGKSIERKILGNKYVQIGLLGIALFTAALPTKLMPYSPCILYGSARYLQPPPIIVGQIIQESGGDPNIVSHTGAVGMAQIMPATAVELEQKTGWPCTNRTNGCVNIICGAAYRQIMTRDYGIQGVDCVTSAYYQGPGGSCNDLDGYQTLVNTHAWDFMIGRYLFDHFE